MTPDEFHAAVLARIDAGIGIGTAGLGILIFLACLVAVRSLWSS